MNSKDDKQSAASPDAMHPEDPLTPWLRLQPALAYDNGIALVTVGPDGQPIGRVENDNRVCQAMHAVPHYAAPCALDCAAAYRNAARAGQIIEYRCHAGLRCFAFPVEAEGRQLVVLGGRVFTSPQEYTQFLRRYEDLDMLRAGDESASLKFMSAREMRAAAERVAAAARQHFQATRKAAPRPAESAVRKELLAAQEEVLRLTGHLESQLRALSHVYDFLSAASAAINSPDVYAAVLEKLCQLLRTERGSLLIVNEETNELRLAAVAGTGFDASSPVQLRVGEGVAGGVLASGLALIVRDADVDNRLPRLRRGQYRSSSFISFPVRLNERKLGVLNFTERIDGAPFDRDDLLLLELLAPHLALLIDRMQLYERAEAYQHMALTDPLTGLPNRRYLEERLYEEVERARRHNTPLAFVILDVDYFKRYNDLYGHTSADRVLVRLAETLRHSVRVIDQPARFAGDEFCIILPETDQEAAAQVAERVREQVARADFLGEQSATSGRVTVSLGVSSFGPTRQSALAVMETADQALYHAKARGRNCVAIYDDAAGQPSFRELRDA